MLLTSAGMAVPSGSSPSASWAASSASPRAMTCASMQSSIERLAAS